MKRFTPYIIVILTFLSFTVSAQGYQGRMTVTQTEFYTQNDSVYVEMEIELSDVAVARRAFILLTPSLKAQSVSVDFPAVMINGKNRAKTYRRLVALNRKAQNVDRVINIENRGIQKTYNYTAAIPYEEWMEHAQFTVKEEQCLCNGPLVPTAFQLLAQQMENRNPEPIKRYQLNFVASFVVPNPEAIKTRSETGKAYLDFAVGRSTIVPDYKNNATELGKINKLIESVNNDPNITITNIIINGYASPEGSYATNMTLSGKRANALKEFLKTSYGFSERLFRVTGQGEDWTTLETIVGESSMDYKKEVLEIIRNTGIFDGREQKLMLLANGMPYKYMLSNMFPSLRRCDYELRYTVLPFTVEKGKEVIRAYPSRLSLNEMFLIAESYEVGSPEFNEVFNIAASTFPNSNIANINAAASALSRKDYSSALAYIDKVSESSGALLNNRGVAFALKGDYGKASDYFHQAQDKGNEQARQNLNQLEYMKKQEEVNTSYIETN